MSTGASRRDTGPDGIDPDETGPNETGPSGTRLNGTRPDGPPLAADRPYVDGTSMSAQELRAEVERLSNEERQHVDDLREEVGDSLAELVSRFDVKARVAEKKDDAVATVAQHVDRARTVVAEGAVTAKDTARQQPGMLAAVAAALLVLLVVLLRRRRA